MYMYLLYPHKEARGLASKARTARLTAERPVRSLNLDREGAMFASDPAMFTGQEAAARLAHPTCRQTVATNKLPCALQIRTIKE